MIQLFAGKLQRPIALLLATIFYCNGVMAGYKEYLLWHYETAFFTEKGNQSVNTVFNPDPFDDNATLFQGNAAVNEVLNDDNGFVAGENKSDGTEASAGDNKDDDNGPSQPEMQAFQSVNNANMVDLFTGDFSYNIPLMDVGGYPVNLSYRSGITMDQEASWVGLGWNINPGTISRNMRGLPDDFNGANDSITKTNSTKENKTVGVSGGLDLELGGLPVNLGLNVGIFHNTYKGWGAESGLNASIRAGNGSKGSLTSGLSVSNNTQEGLTISPSLSVNLGKMDATEHGGLNGSFCISSAYNSRSGIKALNFSTGINGYATDRKNQTASFGVNPELSTSISFASLAYTPTITLPYTSSQYSFTVKFGDEKLIAHTNFFVNGYVSTQKIEMADMTLKVPAYGFLNYVGGAKNPSALLDFNREKEIPYRENPPVPNIAIPSYTYDVFSISGEGSGGMFRAYRGDIGFINDHFIKTKDQSDRFSGDIGIGDLTHFGIDVNLNSAFTQNGPWLYDNNMGKLIAFRGADSTYEPVYFKNPGEKSINSTSFYDAVGGDDVVTVGLYQAGTSSPYITTTNVLNKYKNKVLNGSSQLTSSNVVKSTRDKRTQVITYLTADEASVAGFSKYIENYAVNNWGLHNCNKEFPTGSTADTLKINDTLSIEKRINSFRKSNHLSEVDVLNGDGRRYIYGLPVYNLTQREATFAVNHSAGTKNTGLVAYTPGVSDSTLNTYGDEYFSCETIPAYAHSFLLTAILSSDYVDRTGDGVSNDDLGDAIKFNYSKVAGVHNPFKWRTPYSDSASFNEVLKTDTRDDRGNYVYGEKELWYLNSIESKTMIATFKVENRKDLLPINTSGMKDTTNNNHNGSKLLREINLYSKADFLKNGINARPVKTVHFEYSYTLCRGVNKPQGISYDTGKLTLSKVWFTYNGINAKKRNAYVFNYNSTNPSYNAKSYDRWGDYKDPLQNPQSTSGDIITNEEYPYSLQDTSKANPNSAAWTLDSVTLPSGGRIKVCYESDDYSFVQNKRAMEMCGIAGFGHDSTSTPAYHLYNSYPDNDNLFVFINSPVTLSTVKDIYYNYLEGIDKLYFRLCVKMPSDSYGSGYEYVPCYADIDVSYNGGYGRVNSGEFWIKIKGITLAGDEDGTYSPLAKAAIQFLRLNLASKAYPGSDIGDNIDIGDAVNMALTMMGNVVNAFTTFDATARKNYWVNILDSKRTFIRLNVPGYTKYGGGLRVKTIKIYDHWNTMSGQNQSVYGQKYEYTTTREVNGVTKTISSGVASYEPLIGGDENPFHVPLRYVEKVAPLAPVTLGYVEEPLCESFFPAPTVGYSRVRVRSINTQNTKSANGYEETNFYTAYDFPTITDNTMLDENTKKRYKPAIANFLRIDAKNYLTLSQGFKIELNDMHGKVRSQATYPETDPNNPISYTENFYKVDDQNAIVKHLANTVSAVNNQGEIDTTAIIGKDVEIMTDMREQLSEIYGNDFSPNVDIFVIPPDPIPFVIPSFWYMPQHEEDIYRSVATTKVIQRYGILDSIIHIEKGSIVSTKNLLYDAETGDVLLTRTNNEFNDPIYNFSYPAHWAYSGMGLAYKNIDAVFYSASGHPITINNGLITANGNYPHLDNYFESGDEILVFGKLKTGETTPEDCNGNQTACNISSYAGTFDTSRIWAVKATKIDSQSSLGVLFVDATGNPYSASEVSMKIMRSGKRNIAQTPVGSVTCFKNPIQVKSGKLQVIFDSTSKVLNAGAMIFSDLWKVDNMLYAKDTVISGDSTIVCHSAITDRFVNPYQSGIFGNWRMNKSYVYYSDRDTADPSSATNIRTNGTIKNYHSYWNFDASVLSPTEDTTRWVWNSQSTIFNAKGLEIENEDALGRFNSGKYGYSQSLPVNVTQNSANREQTSEGFEDYGYDVQSCATSCAASRAIDFVSAGGSLDTNYKHSGKYSLKLSAGTNTYVTIPLQKTSVAPSLQINVPVSQEIVTPHFTPSGSWSNWTKSSDGKSFNAKLLAPYTGTYVIEWQECHCKITEGDANPTRILTVGGYSSDPEVCDDPSPTVTVYLTAGTLYDISANCSSTITDTLPGTYVLWQNCEFGSSSIPIAADYIYDPGTSSISVTHDTTRCTKFTGLSSNNMLISSFAPSPGKKYWFSGWVKEQQDCACQSYTNDEVDFILTDSSNIQTTIVLKPKGNIIEGWQRYDDTLVIPSNIISIQYKLKSTGSSAVYFDDLRLHPFNANMKSFVYDPVNLRLLAELDENNYATFYEYDDEGTLIRVKKETQKGIETIKETRSYLNRNSDQ